ncbi:Retrovirus-related Pol polyprotein from transposon TNT 1-94 [Gossypium australe]|uniref:Retrovirus-related Pol polyprotein from transposon TNT 1-94 n=1 Tax=Gossypium australe TaxID=47621 RepID=A0A5B6VPT7_9ROSI|nr:Retrovirus-related Pol polyprotein from transposon TNT 1-94 [Gossypium australe]
MMLRLSFNNEWISLVMNCVTTISYLVVFNGIQGEEFRPTRDDNILFGESDVEGVNVMKAIVLENEGVSGQLVKRTLAILLSNSVQIDEVVWRGDKLLVTEDLSLLRDDFPTRSTTLKAFYTKSYESGRNRRSRSVEVEEKLVGGYGVCLAFQTKQGRCREEEEPTSRRHDTDITTRRFDMSQRHEEWRPNEAECHVMMWRCVPYSIDEVFFPRGSLSFPEFCLTNNVLQEVHMEKKTTTLWRKLEALLYEKVPYKSLVIETLIIHISYSISRKRLSFEDLEGNLISKDKLDNEIGVKNMSDGQANDSGQRRSRARYKSRNEDKEWLLQKGRDVTFNETSMILSQIGSPGQNNIKKFSVSSNMEPNKDRRWRRGVTEHDVITTRRTKKKRWSLFKRMRPTKQNIIGCKSMLKKKEGLDQSDTKYKARLVAKGYSHVKRVDFHDVFSPIIMHTSIQALLALVASNNLELEQLDVKTEFLHGNLDDDIYMQQLEGFRIEGKEDHVFLL